jgi:hypothetical protein
MIGFAIDGQTVGFDEGLQVDGRRVGLGVEGMVVVSIEVGICDSDIQ